MATPSGTVDLVFCQQLPKVELHAHINGSISPSTMEKLTRKKMTSSNGNLEPTFEAIQRWRSSVEKKEIQVLDKCFETFKLIHQVVTDVDSVAMVTHDVIKEFADDGVRYLELRSTPKDNPQQGMTKRSYFEAVMRGIELCEEEGVNIIVKFLPSIDRRMSIAEAGEVVNLALEYQTGGRVVGVDLSGDPNKGDMRELVPLLQRARNSGLKLAIHAAEEDEIAQHPHNTNKVNSRALNNSRNKHRRVIHSYSPRFKKGPLN